MSELRSKARTFYNALNFATPVNFGQDDLIAGMGEDKYVENLHGDRLRDPVQELADQIDLSDSAGAYLFTGNRGTGKTTELLRLATILRQDQYYCEVFYVDMVEYLTLSQRIEVTDFLIGVLGAFSEQIGRRFSEDPGKPSFFDRVRSFLNSNIQFTEIKLPAGWIEFKAALQQNPTFKEQFAGQDARLGRTAGKAGARLRSRGSAICTGPARRSRSQNRPDRRLGRAVARRRRL